MLWFILWLTAIVISRSQSTEECCMPTRNTAILQAAKGVRWAGRTLQHSAVLAHTQEPELELTGRWNGLLLSHNPVIAHSCLSKSRRVRTLWGWSMLAGHQTGMDGVIWEGDHLGAVTTTHFGGETSGLIAAHSWVSRHATLSDTLLTMGFFSASIPRIGGTTTGLFDLQAMHLSQSQRVVFSNTEWAREAAAQDDPLSRSKTLP